MDRTERTREAAPDLRVVSQEGPSQAELERRVYQIRKTMSEAHTGPTRAAHMLCELLDRWDEEGYRALTQAQLDGDAWARMVFGSQQAAANARRTVRAADKIAALGFDRDTVVLSALDHKTLRFLAGESVPDDRRRECVTAVLQAQKAHRGNVFEMARARRLVCTLLDKPREKRVSASLLALAVAHIDKLEQKLRAAKLPVPKRHPLLSEGLAPPQKRTRPTSGASHFR